MRFQIIFFITICAFLLSACTGSNTSTNTTNAATNKAVNAAATNSNNPLATNRAPEAQTANNAPTLAPVVENFYAALQKKDEAGARKYLSQSAIAYYQAEMKTEKMPTLLAILEDYQAPVEEKREVRNEQITGDSGVAEMRGGNLGNWTKIKFVREGGEWKFGSPKDSLSLQDIPRTDAPNAAK